MVTSDSRAAAYDSGIVTYNAAIARKVASRRALGQNVSLVDMYSLLNISHQTDSAGKPLFADISHPNQSGYNVIGNAWTDAIRMIRTISPTKQS